MKVGAFAIGAILGLAFSVALWGLVNWAFAQQKQPAAKAPTHDGGKVIQKKPAELHKFDKPVLKAPHWHPAPIAGHTWHWHALHGWVALPVGVAQFTELAPTYVLPPTVQVLETAKTETIVTCPRTGLPLKVTLEAP